MSTQEKSKLSPKKRIEARSSGVHGKGVFALVDIEPGKKIRTIRVTPTTPFIFTSMKST